MSEEDPIKAKPLDHGDVKHSLNRNNLESGVYSRRVVGGDRDRRGTGFSFTSGTWPGQAEGRNGLLPRQSGPIRHGASHVRG